MKGWDDDEFPEYASELYEMQTFEVRSAAEVHLLRVLSIQTFLKTQTNLPSFFVSS